ncbi:MAG TPA: hypothetical protein DIT15_05745 [Arthrobacter bacterium]|nr:hypothetical protein [Arthrobacter sp.]HAP89685.1 hypothetical protein [Arthrobacter sp.]HBH58499.1 hypothetical protein [Arthrobacter sp.]HCB56705.1 hypothetical protein [Arthrobacter sp.]HCC41297.1 hypothetical protein [Arthrobacter sp.]
MGPGSHPWGNGQEITPAGGGRGHRPCYSALEADTAEDASPRRCAGYSSMVTPRQKAILPSMDFARVLGSR